MKKIDIVIMYLVLSAILFAQPGNQEDLAVNIRIEWK